MFRAKNCAVLECKETRKERAGPGAGAKGEEELPSMAKPKSSYHDPNHHRTSTKPHKPFKGRHGHKSKAAIKAVAKGTPFHVRCCISSFPGKIEKENASKVKVHVPSKIDRRNTQKQALKNKREERARNERFFGGARGAARIVVSPLGVLHVFTVSRLLCRCVQTLIPDKQSSN